jgi:hypothetical protein
MMSDPRTPTTRLLHQEQPGAPQCPEAGMDAKVTPHGLPRHSRCDGARYGLKISGAVMVSSLVSSVYVHWPERRFHRRGVMSFGSLLGRAGA